MAGQRAPIMREVLLAMKRAPFINSNLETLAVYLVGQPPGLIDEFISAVAAQGLLEDDRIMPPLFRAVPADVQKTLLAEIFASHQPFASMPRGHPLSRLLVAIAPELHDRAVIDLAVGGARSVIDTAERSKALAALVSRLPKELQEDLINEALTAATETSDDKRKLEALFRVSEAVVATGRANEAVWTHILAVARIVSDPNELLLQLDLTPGQVRSIFATKLIDVIVAQRGVPPRRENILRTLPSILPIVRERDGIGGVREVYRTISDVGRWFP